MNAETRPFTSAATRAFRERGLAAKKSFGQNFLVDPGIALPALTYMLLAGLWLLKLMAGHPLTRGR